MNRLSQTILPLALGIGLAGGFTLPTIASPRYSHQQSNPSGVVKISPSRHIDYSYEAYEVDYRRDRNVDYNRRDRGYRSRRGRYSDCDRRYEGVGRRSRHYSGHRIIVNPPIYRNSYENRDARGNYIRVIRY